MIDLIESREKIDAIDRQIVELFEERMHIARDVAEYKLSTGKPVFDKEREKQKLQVLGSMAENEFYRRAIEELFTQIMSISRKYQYRYLSPFHKNSEFTELSSVPVNQNTKVAYFGEPGSFSQQAMEEWFGTDVNGTPVADFRHIMEMVKQKEVEFGVLPIENSSTGGITDIYDLLIEYENTIIGEHIIKVEQNLLALPGVEISELNKVYSHPQGIRQSEAFFRDKSEIELLEEKSTSSAARKVANDNLRSQAAIGSLNAAKEYGLSVLVKGINREAQNATRFIVITNQKWFLKRANKVSICFEIPHASGSLYNMLSHIIYNNLNMTKIESRPISGRTWEYRFFIEFDGNLLEAGVQNALNGLYAETSRLRILGNFESILEPSKKKE